MREKGFASKVLFGAVVVVSFIAVSFFFYQRNRISFSPISPDTNPTPVPDVFIESISASSGSIGTEVIIRGANFTSTGNDISFTHPSINFQGRNAAYLSGVVSSDGKTLRFNLPDNDNVLLGACPNSQLKPNETCPAIGILLPKGNVQISVVNKNGRSNEAPFEVK